MNRLCFHYVTDVVGMKQWSLFLFGAKVKWASECLHYFQESEHEHILQGTIKVVQGQPWINTFSKASGVPVKEMLLNI